MNLDQVRDAIDAPLAEYRRIIESYGFEDFFGVGELLRAEGKPWYLAVNFVNPHDVMFVNSDLPEENIQSKLHSMPIARPPADEIYRATWDDVPLPATRGQSFDAPGRPRGQKIYQEVISTIRPSAVTITTTRPPPSLPAGCAPRAKVGDDNGQFIPIRNGKWFFPPKSER